MKRIGCMTVILSEDKRRVLLIKRDDFRIWVPPGGSIDPGEQPEACAVREAREESGYDVVLDRLVGRFHWQNAPDGPMTSYVYAAHVVGGEAIVRGPETREVRWFPVDRLPRRMLSHTKRRVAVALTKQDTPVDVKERMPTWQAWLLRLLVVLRDQYNKYFRKSLYADRMRNLGRGG